MAFATYTFGASVCMATDASLQKCTAQDLAGHRQPIDEFLALKTDLVGLHSRECNRFAGTRQSLFRAELNNLPSSGVESLQANKLMFRF